MLEQSGLNAGEGRVMRQKVTAVSNKHETLCSNHGGNQRHSGSEPYPNQVIQCIEGSALDVTLILLGQWISHIKCGVPSRLFQR